MSGIYIHIPFCAQACYYCDFHFSTNRKKKDTMVDMICQEIELRKDYLPEKKINTVYFGGGTPSILDPTDLEKIITKINKHFSIQSDAEITLEANPDDLTTDKLKAFRSLSINRLSIGIQSFSDVQLRYMNRAHSSMEAVASVRTAQELGFNNISIDLIYGIPSPDHTLWENDLKLALQLQVQHISSYCLTIEPGTVFGRRKEKGTLSAENEEYNAQQFELLIQELEAGGFEQYEVSNFSKPGFISQHNSNYWKGEYYLGAGPGAHSYDGKSRQYNIENNTQYITVISKGEIPSSYELLDEKMRVNEYIMTSLRTKWGVDCSILENKFGIPFANIQNIVEKHYKMGLLEYEKGVIKLTKKGLLMADRITEDLFII